MEENKIEVSVFRSGNLHSAREALHLTRNKVALRLHTDLASYDRYERGAVIPNEKMVGQIADVLNIPLENLWSDKASASDLFELASRLGWSEEMCFRMLRALDDQALKGLKEGINKRTGVYPLTPEEGADLLKDPYYFNDPVMRVVHPLKRRFLAYKQDVELIVRACLGLSDPINEVRFLISDKEASVRNFDIFQYDFLEIWDNISELTSSEKKMPTVSVKQFSPLPDIMVISYPRALIINRGIAYTQEAPYSVALAEDEYAGIARDAFDETWSRAS